jgi:hypothetical protein
MKKQMIRYKMERVIHPSRPRFRVSHVLGATTKRRLLYIGLLTSAHQYWMRHRAKLLVHRSSSSQIHVPRGCPASIKLSNSRRPVDVKVMPAVHGLVPGNKNPPPPDDKDAVAASSGCCPAVAMDIETSGPPRRLNVDAIIIVIKHFVLWCLLCRELISRLITTLTFSWSVFLQVTWCT